MDAEIESLIAQRQEARKNKDFATADRIRDELKERGILLKDTPQGVTWTKAKNRIKESLSVKDWLMSGKFGVNS